MQNGCIANGLLDFVVCGSIPLSNCFSLLRFYILPLKAKYELPVSSVLCDLCIFFSRHFATVIKFKKK